MNYDLSPNIKYEKPKYEIRFLFPNTSKHVAINQSDKCYRKRQLYPVRFIQVETILRMTHFFLIFLLIFEEGLEPFVNDFQQGRTNQHMLTTLNIFFTPA